MVTAFQIIHEIGLCICLYDILSASDGLIGHGTGIVNVNGRRLFQLPKLQIVESLQSSFVLSSSVLSKEKSFSDRSVVHLHMA